MRRNTAVSGAEDARMMREGGGKVLDMNQMDKHLWQGSRPLAGTFVKDAGINCLVSCESGFDPDTKWYPGVAIHHVPLRDVLDPSEQEIKLAREAGELAAFHVCRGQDVLIHCGAGLNRSGLVMGFALKYLHPGSKGTKIITWIQLRRQNALCNDTFVKILEKDE